MTCNAQTCPEYAKFVRPKDERIADLEEALHDIEEELSGVLRVGGCTPSDFEALSAAAERIDEIITGLEAPDGPTAEREAIKKIVIAEKGMHEFTKSEVGVAVCNSILATIEAERE